jgi:serine/threonine protein phosphatase PrpC
VPARGEPPAGGGAGEPGRFPVLRKPSRAATAPWRLPAEPSAAGIAADEAVLGGLQLRAASVSGPSHRSRGIPRQDAYRIGQDSAGSHLIVAVADGMSDSAHSDIGASVAVTALVTALRELLDRGVRLDCIEVREVFLAAARQVYGSAEQRGWTANEVRAVALAAVIPAQPDPDGVRRCWLGAVGDVSAWRMVRDRWERLIGDEKGGLDPSVVERYLPYHYEHLPYGVVELRPGEVMAMTSDGVADAFALGAGVQGWFAERWRKPPPVGSFLLHVGFEQAQFHDDRTAVVVWCDDAADTPAPGGRR